MNSFTNQPTIVIGRFELSKILSIQIKERLMSIFRPYIDSHGQLFALPHHKEQLTSTIDLTFTVLPVYRVEITGTCHNIST